MTKLCFFSTLDSSADKITPSPTVESMEKRIQRREDAMQLSTSEGAELLCLHRSWAAAHCALCTLHSALCAVCCALCTAHLGREEGTVHTVHFGREEFLKKKALCQCTLSKVHCALHLFTLWLHFREQHCPLMLQRQRPAALASHWPLQQNAPQLLLTSEYKNIFGHFYIILLSHFQGPNIMQLIMHGSCCLRPAFHSCFWPLTVEVQTCMFRNV